MAGSQASTDGSEESRDGDGADAVLQWRAFLLRGQRHRERVHGEIALALPTDFPRVHLFEPFWEGALKRFDNFVPQLDDLISGASRKVEPRNRNIYVFNLLLGLGHRQFEAQALANLDPMSKLEERQDLTMRHGEHNTLYFAVGSPVFAPAGGRPHDSRGADVYLQAWYDWAESDGGKFDCAEVAHLIRAYGQWSYLVDVLNVKAAKNKLRDRVHRRILGGTQSAEYAAAAVRFRDQFHQGWNLVKNDSRWG